MARIFVLTVMIVFLGMLVRIVAPGYESSSITPKTAAEEVANPASRHVSPSQEPAKAVAALAKTEPKQEAAQSTKPLLRVAFNTNPPRKYVVDNQAEGIAAEILRSFARRYNLDLAFDFCELPQCLERLKSGESDIVLELAKNDERSVFLEYLDPAISVSAAKSFYTSAAKPMNIASLKDLEGKTVGILEGYSYEADFDRNKAIKKKSFGGVDAMVKALAAGKIDAFIGMEDRTDFILNKTDNKNLVRKADFAIRENILVNFIAMSKKSRFLVEKTEFQETLGSMYLDGTVEQVVRNSSAKFRIATSDATVKHSL